MRVYHEPAALTPATYEERIEHLTVESSGGGAFGIPTETTLVPTGEMLVTVTYRSPCCSRATEVSARMRCNTRFWFWSGVFCLSCAGRYMVLWEAKA